MKNQYEILDLKKELLNVFLNKALRFKVSFEQNDYTNACIKQSCDDEVTSFMRDKFGVEWESNKQAVLFYETTACDIRINAENEVIELYNSLS